MSDIPNSTSVRALILRDHQILVEYFAPCSISFLPGGRLEGKEELRTALARELSEELSGCTCQIGDYLGKIACFWNREGQEDSCLNHYFKVTLDPKGDPDLIRAKEPSREIRWLDLQSQAMMSLTPRILPQLVTRHLSGDTDLWDAVDRAE